MGWYCIDIVFIFSVEEIVECFGGLVLHWYSVYIFGGGEGVVWVMFRFRRRRRKGDLAKMSTILGVKC